MSYRDRGDAWRTGCGVCRMAIAYHGGMRIYIPATPADLRGPITPRLVHAVTDALKRAVPGEDLEGWEMIATLAAADDSLRLLADTARRIVCVAQVDDAALEPDPQLPTAMRLLAEVPWDDVESILVDEPGNEELVRKAMAGDDDAFERSGDIDLMWYDVVERDMLARELAG